MQTLLPILILLAIAVLNAAEKAPPPSSWTDDFSDLGTLMDNWRAYGFLASGIDAAHPLGKTVSGKQARPEWWQIVDGAWGVLCEKMSAWRETELHQTGSTLAPLHFEDFIPAAENPLGKASDGKPVGLEP